jgi:hypothetical protein
LAAGRLARAAVGDVTAYNPVGYVLSADKNRDAGMLRKRADIVAARLRRQSHQAAERLRHED